jgi:hypothetical protein
MRWWSRPSRPLLAVVALAFAASLLVHTGLWLVLTWPEPVPNVQLGFDDTYLPSEHAQLINAVFRGSPAEKAGILPGDRIMARGPARKAPSSSRVHSARIPSRLLAGYSASNYPTGFPCPLSWWAWWLFFCAWRTLTRLLVLVFGGVIASRGMPPSAHPAWWPLAMAYEALLLGMLGPLFYWFFAVFPVRSPIDRRLPWLKWTSLAVGFALALGGIRIGALRLPPPLRQLVGERASNRIAVLIVLAYLTLGLVSFATNFFTTEDPETRRKIRVMFWGTVVSFGPNLADVLVRNFTGRQDPQWLSTLLTALLFLFPLSFAYAVAVHRVLEIPVLLRRSARYLLVQRGFTFLLSLVSVGLTLLFAMSFARYLQPIVEIAEPSGIALGAVFGPLCCGAARRCISASAAGSIAPSSAAPTTPA